MLVAAVALVLNVSWIILNWREVVPLILGVIFFGFIIAGVILNTIFLVREVRAQRAAGQLPQRDHARAEDADHLDPPVPGDAAATRPVDDAQRREFYQIMLEDTQRLMGTVEQVLRAARVTQKNAVLAQAEVEVGPLVQDARGAGARRGITFRRSRWSGSWMAQPAERLARRWAIARSCPRCSPTCSTMR